MLRLLKILLLIPIIAMIAVLALAFAALEEDPLVRKATAPTPQEVVQARDFVRSLRRAIDPSDESATLFVADPGEMNSLAKLGSRLVPGLRSQIITEPDRVELLASLPMPLRLKRSWLNLRVTVPPFEGEVSPSQVMVGTYDLPPGPMLQAARLGGNLLMGEGFGDKVLSSASAMQIEPDRLVFTMTMDRLGSNGIMRGLFGSMRGADMPAEEDILRYHDLIRAAMDDGSLPTQGSYLPHILFTLDAALEGSQSERADNAFTSAIFALALACGAGDFNLLVGGLTDSSRLEAKRWKTSCEDLTLNGRIDSRRHFTTAAALKAASNRGFAVSIGEFKELYDSRKRGGFDFTDIAANNSGIRMSDLFMSVPASDWLGLIARIQAENDVIVPFSDIPGIMPRAAFTAAYGDVDSRRYQAQLARIETQIDTIALHR